MSQIDTLIDKQDSAELVRDQIAAILLTEQASQQALATAAGKDPNLWALRVFLERDNPWSEFQETPDTPSPPIVNVSLESESFDASRSDRGKKQHDTATYHVDVYGYGISQATVEGHAPGDALAATECHRARRLVRNILMSAHYAYLGFARGANQFVWSRWIRSTSIFKPPFEVEHVQNITACRMSVEVEFDEYAPQITPVSIGTININILRADNGEILLEADFPTTI